MRRRALLQLLGLAPLIHAGHASGLDVIGGGGAQPVSGASPDVELTLTAAPGETSLLPGRPTRVWRFTAEVVRGPASTLHALDESYLGPVIRLRRGQRVRIRFRNQLDEPSIVHWHGLDVPELADGHPRFAVEQGAEYVYDFEVSSSDERGAQAPPKLSLSRRPRAPASRSRVISRKMAPAPRGRSH